MPQPEMSHTLASWPKTISPQIEVYSGQAIRQGCEVDESIYMLMQLGQDQSKIVTNKVLAACPECVRWIWPWVQVGRNMPNSSWEWSMLDY